MTFHIITLFPNAFKSYLGESIIKRAIEDGKISVRFYNPRDFTENKWKRTRPNAPRPVRYGRVDRAPYGGGPGMVIQAEPVIRAIEAAFNNVYDAKTANPRNVRRVNLPGYPTIRANGGIRAKGRIDDKKIKIIWLTPSGKQFTNKAGIALAKHSNLIIVCGRYEGIDARVKKVFRVDEVSVGPFVLTGGELPAMMMIDVVSRQVPGVLGDPLSREEARIASPDVYTRPEVFAYRGKRYRVPHVLLTGHHARIDKWKLKRRK